MARFSSNRPTSAPSLRLRLRAHLCADVLKQAGDHAQANRRGYGDISVDECGFERVAAVLDHLVVDGDADMYPERIAIDIEQRRTRMPLERTTTTVVRKRSISIASARRIRSPESIRQKRLAGFLKAQATHAAMRPPLFGNTRHHQRAHCPAAAFAGCSSAFSFSLSARCPKLTTRVNAFQHPRGMHGHLTAAAHARSHTLIRNSKPHRQYCAYS